MAEVKRTRRNRDYRKMGTCCTCGRERKILARGMCSTCYANRYRGEHAFKVKTCPQCGRTFQTARPEQITCGASCHGRRANHAEPCGKDVEVAPMQWTPAPPIHIVNGGWFCAGRCVICGRAFVSREARQTCSSECKRIAYVRKRRNVSKRRRARTRHARIEMVRAEDIFERDGWTCQLCGCDVHPWGGHWQANMATLDHIKPLAKGGTHEVSNLQCLCSMCNSKKRDLIGIGLTA